MMNKEAFFKRAEEEIRRKLGEGYVCTLMENKKINQTCKGILIQKDGEKISPTIYLEPFYEMYLNGESMERITANIIRFYREHRLPENPEVLEGRFWEFANITDCIILKVISKERNEALLLEVPHVELEGLGLAVIFYVELELKENMQGGVLIRKEHMKMWNTNIEHLLLLATANTQRLHEFTIKKMGDVIREILGGMEETESIQNRVKELEAEREAEMEHLRMYVLTDEQTKSMGASELYLKTHIRAFAREHLCDVYILPSSVHELLLIRADDPYLLEEELQAVVEEVNEQVLEEADFLSNSVYKYILEKDTIITCN